MYALAVASCQTVPGILGSLWGTGSRLGRCQFEEGVVSWGSRDPSGDRRSRVEEGRGCDAWIFMLGCVVMCLVRLELGGWCGAEQCGAVRCGYV